MSEMEKNLLLDGPPDAVILRAGPVTVRYARGDIRYIRVGPHEVLRRVYAAVRDHNWGTLIPRIHNEQIDQQADSFRVHFDALHVRDDIEFVWHGRITGETDGTITFTFDGEARSTFRRNRVGFCVLHPTHLAGQPCTVRHTDDRVEDSRFPLYISPHQPFFDIRAIAHEVAPGLRAEVIMEGDTFEMEDQRNWTDASYKTYCTPLGLPFPVTVPAGTRIQQRVTIRLHGDAPQSAAETAPDLVLSISEKTLPLPLLGVGKIEGGLTLHEVGWLKAMQLHHLRLDFWMGHSLWRESLSTAYDAARALGIRLEIALYLTDSAESELADLRAALDEFPLPVARWLIFHVSEKSTQEKWVRLARETLGDTGAAIGTGTDYFFTELNRQRPPVEAADFITYSLNPQVHAFENIDLIETLPVQASTVESARQFSAGRPVIVSPVTFRTRRNPNATSPQPQTPLDPRHKTLFGAAWTVGSIKHLAQAGAHSVTYYETVLGHDEVFPLYHVLADVGEFGGEVVVSESSDALAFDGLVLRKGDRTRILLANYTRQPQTITVPGIHGVVTVKRLDETHVGQATRSPEAFRQTAGQIIEAGPEGLGITLLPYAVARVDV